MKERTKEQITKELRELEAKKKKKTVMLEKEEIQKVTIHEDGWPEWDFHSDIKIQINGFGERFNKEMSADVPEERLYQFVFIDVAKEEVCWINTWNRWTYDDMSVDPGKYGKELYQHLIKLDPSIKEEVDLRKKELRKEDMLCAS